MTDGRMLYRGARGRSGKARDGGVFDKPSRREE
jgi:hypothetical protein